MDMDLAQYRSKLMGCWLGKSIGGTLGAPYEGRRRLNEVTYYKQDLKGNPPANDDLDLQLLWLVVVERYGTAVNAEILGEYWNGYIVPHWAEYGISRNNMRNGIRPPLSGHFQNEFKDSNGSFIRSEIWACLAPGHPEIAVRYAFEDAIVDHADEGLYAEIFTAALESAAFVEHDKRKLIDIALSYIPADCGITRGVKSAIEAYDSGMTWQEARIKVMNDVPGSFGQTLTRGDMLPKDIAFGKRGWDAPSNVGITILAWFFGEDDLGKSLCIAVNCGEDTDCTAATLGSIMGIIGGAESLPAEWKDPIGDTITIGCLNTLEGKINPPKRISELTERIIRKAPQFLGGRWCEFIDGFNIKMLEPDSMYCRPNPRSSYQSDSFFEFMAVSPNTLRGHHIIFNTEVEVVDGPEVMSGTPKKFRVKIENTMNFQQWVNFKWLLPEGWSVDGGNEKCAYLMQYEHGYAKFEFDIVPGDLQRSKYEVILDISSEGHYARALIPVTLLVLAAPAAPDAAAK